MPGKYSGINGIVDNNFTIVNSVHPTLRDSCARIINQSSATNSWNQLRSVLKLTKRLQTESGVNLCLPWDQASVLNFILLMAQKQHKHSTIRVYVSRLRWWHKLQGTIYLFFLRVYLLPPLVEQPFIVLSQYPVLMATINGLP